MNKLPSAPTMYRALVDRDTTFEGIFYAGVKTTGIFCRPTCPARKPRPENIEYFASPQEALCAGYRPCSRCHPIDRDKKAPEVVKRLCEVVEQAPIRKISDSEIREMGFDPSTARRQFKRHYGMTFQAYQRARRMGLALHDMRDGESVIGAQINTGFESASGFWEAFKQLFGAPPSKSGLVNCLLAKWIETPLGAMLALADDRGLHMLEFIDRRALESQILRMRKRLKCCIVPGSNRHLEHIHEEMNAYFNGSLQQFSVPMVVAGTKFEEVVWTQLRKIPYAETWSYAQLARKIGNPSAIRAVGSANGRNCLAIIIPCHRVIRSDGSLCGYGGGVWRKQWLLDHERSVIGGARVGDTLDLPLTPKGRK